MPIAQALANFRTKAAQCDALIANAHKADPAGVPFFSPIDREQITVAAFLNLFVAWEEFLEFTIANLLTGVPTLSGALPPKFASPPTADAARAMLIGVNRYFDYANHDFVQRVVPMYFQGGYPFQPHLRSISTDLADLRTMRNASAHLSSTTHSALEALAQRIFGTPQLGISLYTLLTRVDPRGGGGNTVFAEARDKLLVAAQLIATG